MTYIGFDHHKKWTQAAAIDEQGKIIREIITVRVWLLFPDFHFRLL